MSSAHRQFARDEDKGARTERDEAVSDPFHVIMLSSLFDTFEATVLRLSDWEGCWTLSLSAKKLSPATSAVLASGKIDSEVTGVDMEQERTAGGDSELATCTTAGWQ